MSTLLERVLQTVSEQALFGAGDVLVVAVSGGADSTALALLVAQLAPDLGARLAGLAHLNHQLRAAADGDEAFCQDLAARLGVAFDSRRVDVAAEARARKTSVEDAARTVRYSFLSDVAADRGATRVAVGHTRNDQAETVLLRLARGAGPTGLAAIYPRAGQVIRPLLDARRSDVEAWLRARGQGWREDESNQDRAFARNKVRHELLPWLTGAFGAGVVDVLARQAALSRDDADWFELVATETASRLVIEDGDGVRLEPGALGALHPAIGRRVVLAVLRRVAAAGAGAEAAAEAPSSGSTTSMPCWRWRWPVRGRSICRGNGSSAGRDGCGSSRKCPIRPGRDADVAGRSSRMTRRRPSGCRRCQSRQGTIQALTRVRTAGRTSGPGPRRNRAPRAGRSVQEVLV